MENLVLIDANSLINRAFYALPPLNNADGTPTQAVYGFTTMLLKLIEVYQPKYIAATFDLPKPTFRHLRYDGYKATRKGMPDELAVQIPLLKDLLRAMNIAVVEKEGYEADDLIGTLAKRFDIKTFIVTGDRDSLQLIDESTEVLLTKRGITEILRVNKEVLKNSFSLLPNGVIEYKALAGDSSDNIPGVAGIGEKTAMNLLEMYSCLEGIYSHIDEIKGKLREKLEQGKEMAFLSRELATIDTNAPIDCTLQDLTYDFPFGPKVRELFGKYNFRTLYKKDELFGKQEKTCDEPELQIVRSADLQVGEVMALHFADKVYVGGERGNFAVNLAQTLLDEDSEAQIFERLKPYLEDESIVKVFYDYKTFLKLADSYGIEPKNIFDIKLAEYLLGVEDFSQFDTLMEAYGYEPTGYGAYKVYVDQKKLLEDSGLNKLYYEVELPLERVLFDMEKRGFKLDLDKLERLNRDYSAEAERCARKVYELAGRTFNINSPKQLAAVLFDELKIPYPKRSKSYSTSADILEPLADRYEIIAYVLRYRSISKLVSTYLEGLKKQTDRQGFVHTEFKQMMTATGRLSSAEPNLQNIPIRDDEGKALREIFVANTGNLLISADYSQIELRVMAHLSRDEKMVDCYQRGEDIHTATAAEVFGVDPSEVTEKMRREAKTVNFGIIYGMSDFGLSKSLGISVPKAKAYITRYFEKFSGVKKYLDESVESAKKSGYATTILGRIRRIPELASPNFQVRGFGERAAMNTPLQGSAADIIKIAMLRVEEALRDTNAKLILQIHDELIVETPVDEAERVTEIVRNCMESAFEFAVPLKVSVGVGKNLMECK